MKTRFCFYYLFILLTTFFFSYGAEDSCPTGMRKLYVDDVTMQQYGAARSYLAAVAFFQFPGSLFFKRKVLIEPRFEVHLKATIDPVDIVEKTREQKIYGFTIVISGYKNTISGLDQRNFKGEQEYIFNDIGYNNFVNSLIIEFDFEKDTYDPDSNSFSVRFCKTSCSSEDYNAMYYNRLNSQRYDKSKTNNWDFRLIYDTKKLYILSGPNDVIFAANYDLEGVLGTNIAFVGFTGFMESNRRELSLIGSFICEDNYEIKKMAGYFLLNGQLYENAEYEAGTPINYLFSFINNRDQLVPHTYGYNIWSYNFTLNTDCGLISYTMSKKTNYTLVLAINACTKAGIHYIHIAEKLKGDAPERYYIVKPGPLNKIILIGHDGIIKTVPMKNDNYLNYGDSSKGDFIFKKNLKLVLDFEITDKYGNPVTLDSPGTLFDLKKVNKDGGTSTVTSNIISYTMQKVNDHYQMTLSANKIGTYQIENSKYMSKPIRFIIIPGEANPNLSFCSLSNNNNIEYSSPPNLLQEETVNYNCYLRDEYGNEIDTETFAENSIYDFSCQTQRTSPTSKTYSNSYIDKTSFFSCQYTTRDTGVFQINGYLTKKGTTSSIKINPKINQFSVRGNANSLIIKNVLNLYNYNWVDANGAVITYVSQQNGKLTVLDFAESNGGSLISSYGTYPEGFDVNKITAELNSPHDINFRHVLKPKKEVFEGAEYIVLYTNNVPTDQLIKRSSFDYTIKINYKKDNGNEEKVITIKYIINIGSYKTCFHDFKKEKTYLDQSWELQFLTGGAEMKIAKIELRTNDDYLYNYDIGKAKIEYILEPTNGQISFRVVPLTIEGTYDIYVKSNADYQGFLIVKVDGYLLRKQWVSSQQSLACYLEFIEPQYFIHKGDDFKEHYYDYQGPFVDGNLLFQFIIRDKFQNIIAKEDYFSCFADIYSHQYGNDITKFNIFYNHTASAYQFRDNLPFESRKYTWVFFMRDSSCNNKYYINYDGMRGGTPVSIENSYYNLLNTKININEIAYVDVYYKDINGQFLGLQNDKLEEAKVKTKVIATSGESNYEFEFDSINSNYAIRYKRQFTKSGTFKVIAKLEDTLLRNQTSNILNVIDNIYSFKHSQLKLILNTIIDMDPSIRVTIDNTVQDPVYKLYFYSATGVKTTYDQNIKFSCFLEGDQVNMELDVTKKNDYVQFTHKDDLKDYFKSLTKGDYTLKVSDNKESIDYPLYLTGDGSNDTTNDPNLIIDKTEVYPTHINGVAGKTYSINIEFRVKGGFRWNFDVDTSKLLVSNSYNLGNKEFVIKVERGYKKGQAIIYVTQTKATDEKDNILTLSYNGEKIPKTVSLTIKCGDLAKLVYESGPTEGDVITPPILTFKPVDKYGNLYTDLFTNPTSQAYLNSLTIGKAYVPLTSNNYLEDNKFLKVQYLSTISTNVIVTSSYFDDDENYKYRIRSGPIDKDVSYAELKNGGNKVGEEYHIVIYPRDKYNNEIDDLGEVEMEDFYTYYGISGGNDKNNVTDCHLIEETENDSSLRQLSTINEIYDSIECQTSIYKTGSLQFHVDYIKDEIECRNCQLVLVSNTVSFMNTKTYYKNKKVYLDKDKLNEVQAKIEPIFELTFFDEYLNQLDRTVVQKLNIYPTFEKTDIKLCISNSGNKKIVTLCPSSNGDDNVNKWQYLTNGDNYTLKLQDKNDENNVITYPIKITGGSNDGSSEEKDLTKTHFEPEVIKTQAGVEGQTIMEIRTAKNIRKNYWYPNPSDKIKVEFDNDQNSCSYKIEKGDLPGQYVIKVTCTKTNDNNSFSVTVESTKLTQKIKLIITSGPAYYLEVEDVDKFTVSSDKYIWKENPTNDDIITFSFKLKDQYYNYITHSVIEDNEITINSELYGSSNKYYSLSFNNNSINYLFTDKIEEVVTKHIWDIVCVASNRTYSFIYTKVPGKVDVTKSSWTIDKTNYILYETSTVLITLVDRLGVNVGTVEGRLLNENGKIKVNADNYGKVSLYNYNSITKDNKLEYKNKYQLVGKYNISVTYDNKQIQKQVEITVSYQTIDLKKSRLYYDLYNGKENLMKTTEQTNIDNKKEYPFYKLYLYTPEGELINIYDKSIKVSCKMTYSISDDEWELDVKKGNNYFNFTYQDGFKTKFEKLPFGSYSLHINLDGETIIYPLYLLGEKDVSVYNDYDLTKTYINPTYINGIAGEQYEIDIEFRAKDNLRWNYEININSFEISNTYKLSNENLTIVKMLGEKNGQMKLLVTQKIASTGGVDNMLHFKYKSESIPTPVTLHIKCAKLYTLEYHSGAVDGTVVNPSIVKFIPRDKFKNIYTDLFDNTLYPKEKLEKLTNGVSVEGYKLTTNNYVSDGKFLNVQYGCKNVTTIKVTCNNNLNNNTYKYKLWSGPVDPDKSYAEIEKTKDVVAGDISKLIIYPKDIYGNNVTNLTKDDLDKFDVDYEVNKVNKVDISKLCGIAETLLPNCKANITKSGDVIFTVDYNDKPVNCRNCEFFINPDKIDFSKTKVFDKNDNKEMSKTELNTLPVTILPNFELYFFDRFMNPTINKTEVEELPVITEFVVTDVKLCVANNGLTKLATVCKSTNITENEEKWFYLPDGDKYKLLVKKSKTLEQLSYPCKLTGGYKDGSSEPVDPLKTFIDPNEITLVAGEEGKVLLELRTAKNERKNYWYKEPKKYISVTFPEKVKNCTYSLSQYEKPGQYSIIFNCTKKENPFNTTVFVEKTEVPTKVTTTVIPAGPAKSKLFRMNYTEITNPDLGSVSVEDKFQMINILYDKYDNQITNINFELSTLQIKITPINTVIGHSWSADPLPQNNGEIIITLKSTYANKHVVTGLYFPDKYNILFTHGEPNADNSLLEVSKTEAWVGEEVKIYITPYDKYNNYIDAMEYADISPYQVKYTNAGSKTKVIMEKYIIEKKDELNVLSYNGAFYVKGITKIDGYIDTQEIKCITCRINIKTKDVDFLNSYVLRFDSSKNDFELLKNGTVEKNTKEEPIYRLYPRDHYLNDVDFIPKEKLEKYKAYLKNQNESTIYHLKLNNKQLINQEYAEFIINDDETVNRELTYKTLVGGFYDLVFTDEDDNLKFNITLEGNGQGGSNEPADYQKTFIIDQNLTYIAGNSGYMMIEIRTKNNIRKNLWDGFDFTIKSCDEKDKTFNFTQERAGIMGVFLITVTTQKANTYPKLTECPLKIYLNDEKIENLNPLMEVYPDAVVRTKILDKYYKKGSTTNLLDGTADSNYIFEVASFDQYDNFAETIQEVVGIKVALKGGNEVKNTNSETNTDSGYREYNVPAKKAGIYVVSSDKFGPKGLYMPHESIFVIYPGVIDLSKTIIKEKATPIQAGTAPAISIDAFDKNGNALNYTNYINNFTAIFIDAKNEEHNSTGEYDQDIQKVYYTSDTPVTIVGKVKVEVTFNKKEKLDTSKVIIEVIPGDPDPSKSILSRQTSKGVFTQYKNGDSFSVDVKEYLILNITLYDKYNNYISNIPADVKIIDPIIFGNYMEEIKFNVTQNTGYFELDFNDNSDYIYVYQHLVSGTYDLTYVVNTSLAEASFKYNIIISNGDKDHGNGKYVIEKCILKPKNVSFIAGNYEQFTLELRTQQGLLYNDDINIDTDILIHVEDDNSFISSVTKAGSDYGIYTIKIYSEKKGEYIMNVLLADPSTQNKTKKEVGPGFYTVYPDKVPDKRYTVIKTKPENPISAENNFEISYTLADKFNNSFIGRHDMVDNKYLTLINNDEPLDVVSLTLLSDEQTYRMIVYPKYPPKNMSMNVLYNDGENTVYCFLDNINLTIKTDIGFKYTTVISSNRYEINVGEVLDMWLYTFDQKGVCLGEEDYSDKFKIIVTGPMDSVNKNTKEYEVIKTNNKNGSECTNEYKIVTDENKDKYKYSGEYHITVKGEADTITENDQKCSPLGYSLNGFLLEYDFDPNKISILDTVSFTVSGTDEYGNKIEKPLINDIEISFTKDNKNTEFEQEKIETETGKLQFDVAIRVIGSHQLHMFYKGEEVLTVNNGEKLPIFTILTGPCRAENNEHFDLSPLNETQEGEIGYFSFQCYDIYNNKITHGGEQFTVTGQLISNTIEYPISNIEVIDNKNGKYDVKFFAKFEGTYFFNLLVGKERYGEEVKWTLKNKECTGEESILCPNVNECVKDILDCIPKEKKCEGDRTKPFKCKVRGKETCVASQTDCDCPVGYKKCEIMNFCYKEGREDMCPYFKRRTCKDKFRIYLDGLCRPNTYHGPNQRVCPIGQVLCADLSCRNNYDECEEAGIPYDDGSQQRCIGQALVPNVVNCPSTYVCPNKDDVVCSNGECVSNEIECPALQKCNDPAKPYRCQNNDCKESYEHCTLAPACGDDNSLCSDNVCRDEC